MQTMEKQRVAAVAPTTTRKTKSFQDSYPNLPGYDTPRNRYRVAHLAERGDRTRPASMLDVIVDRGEHVGDGIPRDASGHRYEPLDWGALIRI